MSLEKNDKVGDAVDAMYRQNGRFTSFNRNDYLNDMNNLLNAINNDMADLKNKLTGMSKGPDANAESVTIHGKLIVEGSTFADKLHLSSINNFPINEVFDDTVK